MPAQTLPAQPYIFISYASRNRAQVLAIAHTFDRVGVRYWLDNDAIEGGTSYGTEIAEAIRNAAAFVLMCSAPALASRNVKQELQLAWKHARPYLPLLLEPCTFPPEIEYWLEGSQWVEVLTHPESEWLPRTLRALHRLGAVPTADTAAGETAIATGPTALQGRAAVTNLPVPLTSFVGRAAELAELPDLLTQYRLLTLGGVIAQFMAALAPERVRGLILLASLDAGKAPQQGARRTAVLMSAALAAARLPVVGARLRARLGRPHDGFDATWTRAAALRASEYLIPGTGRASRRLLRDSYRERPLAVETLRQPCLVVSGALDTTVPPTVGAELAARIPGARHVVLPDCSHGLTRHQPQAVADLILSEVASDTPVR